MASSSIVTECSLCCENFKDPRILSCGHTFCFTCLEKLVSIRGESACPVCRQTWNTPVGGLKNLSKNYAVNEILEQMNKSLMCKIHNSKEVCAYCEPCGSLTCLTCIRTSHKNHDNIMELDEADKVLRTKVQNLVTEYNKTKEVLTNKYQTVVKSIDNIEKTATDSLRNVEEAAAKACSELDTYVQLIKNSITKSKFQNIKIIQDVKGIKRLRLSSSAQKISQELVKVEMFLATSQKITTIAERCEFVQEVPNIGELPDEKQLDDFLLQKNSCRFNKSSFLNLQYHQDPIITWNVVKTHFSLKNKLPSLKNQTDVIAIFHCRENQFLTSAMGDKHMNVHNDSNNNDSQNYVINVNPIDAIIASNNTII